ncbi:MAG: GvpL/GvpF family gas vesicle protein, partial [Rhodopila sp.]
LDNDMILNRAFLVRRENEALFDSRIQVVAERCSGRVDFRYFGPVPPYNFVRLQVAWLAGTA